MSTDERPDFDKTKAEAFAGKLLEALNQGSLWYVVTK